MVEHIVQQIIRDYPQKKKIVNELYTNTRNSRVVKTGTYKNVKYWITTIGIHPCAYVECSQEFLKGHQNEWDDINGIDVHGGVTFGDQLFHLNAFKEENVGNITAFGWNYGHAGDWAGYRSDMENTGSKKWELDEIEKECHSAIDQYLNLLEEEKRNEVSLSKNPDWENCETLREVIFYIKSRDKKIYLELLEKFGKVE